MSAMKCPGTYLLRAGNSTKTRGQSKALDLIAFHKRKQKKNRQIKASSNMFPTRAFI